MTSYYMPRLKYSGWDVSDLKAMQLSTSISAGAPYALT